LLFVMSAIAASIWGKLSDHWISAGSSTTFVRKGSMALGCGGFAISLSILAVAPEPLFTWMLIPTGMLLGIGACPTWAIPQTLAGPEMVGRWVGMQNFVGNFAGAVAPALTGYLLDRTGLFYWPFFITAGVAAVGALAWTLIIGPIEEVNWHATTLAPAAIGSAPSPQALQP
jgi:MFS transporter, ACS family, D-galactonate transporter